MRALLLALLCLAAARVSGEPAPLADGQAIRGQFQQLRQMQGFTNPVRSEGHFLLVPGRGLIWTTDRPFLVTTVLTPEGLVQNAGGNGSFKIGAANLPMLTRLYAMMSAALAGNWRALETDFAITHDSAGKHERFRLTPLRADPSGGMLPRQITITVGRFVEKVDIERSGGDSDHLSFSNQTLGDAALQRSEVEDFSSAEP
jgi:hypothetical protein